MHDTIINTNNLLRINPIQTVFKDNDQAYAIVFEFAVGGRVEGRQYTYIDRTEAEEVMEYLERILLNNKPKDIGDTM